MPAMLTHAQVWTALDRLAARAKLSPSGTLLFSTYLGGAMVQPDTGLAVAVDADGSVYLTGQAGSMDFPTTAGASASPPFPIREAHASGAGSSRSTGRIFVGVGFCACSVMKAINRSLKSRAMVYAESPANSRSTISRMSGARSGSSTRRTGLPVRGSYSIW